MKMTLIPKEHIASVWGEVSGHLESAAKTVRPRHDIVDIMEDCMSGRQVLWVVFDDEDENKTMGAMTTSMVHYPRYTAINIPYMGGHDMLRYRDLIIDVLTRFGRDNGCTSLECYGRDAWGKVGEKYGFKKAFSMFELDLTVKKQIAAE